MSRNITENNTNETINTALPDSVPYIVMESVLNRNEHEKKRDFIIKIVLIIAFLLSNMAWLYAWNQYDYSTEETRTITVDGKDGNANYAEDGGVITNGSDYSNYNENEDKEEENWEESGNEEKEEEKDIDHE